MQWKNNELGGKVIAMSDSSGYVYSVNGLDLDKMKQIKEEKDYARRIY